MDVYHFFSALGPIFFLFLYIKSLRKKADPSEKDPIVRLQSRLAPILWAMFFVYFSLSFASTTDLFRDQINMHYVQTAQLFVMLPLAVYHLYCLNKQEANKHYVFVISFLYLACFSGMALLLFTKASLL